MVIRNKKRTTFHLELRKIKSILGRQDVYYIKYELAAKCEFKRRLQFHKS